MILNEREARDARSKLTDLDEALSQNKMFEPGIIGLPPFVAMKFRELLAAEKSELNKLVTAYENAKTGDYVHLKEKIGNDPGLSLIVARIARGMTQKDLARKLGLKEQQIQRYESDRYRTISLANFKRVATVLGVNWDLSFKSDVLGGWSSITKDVEAVQIKKVLKHAKNHGWFEEASDEKIDTEESFNYLQRYISDHMIKYGSPSLLRTGLNVVDHSEDLLLIAWRARVTRIAEGVIKENSPKFQALDISWLNDLKRLSLKPKGPKLAQEFLLSKGIVLIAEPQIQGLKVDGAAFLVDGIPVIGMTLRHDRLDNFWFTLLHEIGHVILHYKVGLSVGFFDDTENKSVDELELEADDFASNILIPEERWTRSPARITNSSKVIEKFAVGLEIHPAIVFGRVRNERGYTIFSDKIGRGLVRKHLLEKANGNN